MDKDSSIDEIASLTRNSSTTSSASSTSSTTKGSKGHLSKAKKCRAIFLNMDSSSSEKRHICSNDCLEKYPIHHAARLGNFRLLRTLLDDPNCPRCPLQTDECLGRTPLHYACATGNVEKGLMCVKLLLGCKQVLDHANASEKIKGYVNNVDKFGKSALHLAAKNEATQIVIELLTNQADFDISSVDGTCALREIYKNTPDAMEEALNQSIGYVEACSRASTSTDNVSIQSSDNMFDFTRTCVNVCLDFYPVIGSKMNPEECEAVRTKSGKVCKRVEKMLPETQFLFTVNRKRMAANQRRQMLTNSLVEAFLHFKWQKIKWFCFIAIFFHAVWLSLYIGTLINVFVVQCPYKTQNGDPETPVTSNVGSLPLDKNISLDNNSPGENEMSKFFREPSGLCINNWTTQVVAGVLLIMSVAVSFKEFFQFIRLRSMYLRFENVGQCTLLSFIYITVPTIYMNNTPKVSALHYQIAAFGIFLAWTLLLCQLAKLPRLSCRFNLFGRRGSIIFPDHGIYVEILSRVFKNFLIFITIFSSLLISFVFSFNILLPNSAGFVNLTNAMVKVLTMMTGELNYDDIFHADDAQIIYPVSTHLMYAIFIMVATIILFNLLIGFTVSDIQGLQKDAEINQISNKLEQIFLMECFLLSSIMQKTARILGTLFLRKENHFLNHIMVVKKNSLSCLCYHTTIRAIPFELRVKIRNHASKNCLAISDVTGRTRSTMFESRYYEH